MPVKKGRPRPKVARGRPVPRTPQPSRYLTISRDLAREIFNGAFPVGSTLPSELTLCRRYRASRQTIREAMRRIVDMGLVRRRRGKGTTVLAVTPIPTFTHSVASITELQQYAEETHLRIERTEHVVARRKLADRLQCPEGRIWLRSEGWRMAGEREPPICWTEVYIDEAFAAVEEDLGRSTGLIFGHLARRFGLVLREVRQIIRAVPMSGAFAARLGVPEHSPALEIERRYFTHGSDPVEIAFSIHPGERFSYAVKLTSAGAAHTASPVAANTDPPRRRWAERV